MFEMSPDSGASGQDCG